MSEKQEALKALEEKMSEWGDSIAIYAVLGQWAHDNLDVIRAALAEAPKVDVWGLKRHIPVGEEYEEPDPTDMYAAAPFENGSVLGFARGYNAAIDHITTHYDLVKKETPND